MTLSDWTAAILMIGGLFFYVAGTFGVLRFPDDYARLQALTKADNVGLLLVACGAAVLAGSLWITFLLLFIWLLSLITSSVSAQLLARHARERQS